MSKPSAVNPNSSRFRAAHASFRLRMLHEQHAPVAAEPPVITVATASPGSIMKDTPEKKEKRSLRKFPFHMARSDSSQPGGTGSTSSTPTTTIPPSVPVASRTQSEKRSTLAALDLCKTLSGSQRKKLYSSTPPHTPTTLSVDAAETIIAKQKINRSASSGSTRKRLSGGSADDGAAVTVSPLAGGASAVVSSSGVTSTSAGGHHGPPSPKGIGSSVPHKSKFKMAHESFRIRMFQEQYGFEPVFMTKKRAADSKFSEFKGGDLNKYTSRSYTIKDGVEIFGGHYPID
uniref:Flocculation protein FLO11-like n=1 Tax=Panagrellus redivivus TaxID=6233 RepID=A0A7E4VF33_PANRE